MAYREYACVDNDAAPLRQRRDVSGEGMRHGELVHAAGNRRQCRGWLLATHVSPVKRLAHRPAVLGVVFTLAALVVAVAPPSYAMTVPPSAESGAIAHDAVAGRVYVAQPVSDSIFVLTARTMRLLTVLKVPATPSGIAVDPAHGLIYVASDPAGMISVFDDKTFGLVRIYPVGGHPAGVALLNNGSTLLITDAESGAIRRLPVPAGRTQPAQVYTIGPGAAPTVQLAPRAAASGQQTLAWARGFTSGEPVEVYWGWQPLVGVTADAAGIVMAHFRVPAGESIGQHLVVLQGKWSTTTESTLISIVRAPVVRRLKHRTLRPGHPSLLQRLLVPAVTIPLPGAKPKGRSVHARPAQSGLSIPMLYVEGVALVLLVVLVIRTLLRRRKRARAAPQEGGGKSKKERRRQPGARARPTKKAA